MQTSNWLSLQHMAFLTSDGSALLETFTFWLRLRIGLWRIMLSSDAMHSLSHMPWMVMTMMIGNTIEYSFASFPRHPMQAHLLGWIIIMNGSGGYFYYYYTYIHTTKFIERQNRKERIGGAGTEWLGSESWLEKVWFEMTLKCTKIVDRANVCR